MWLAVRHFGMGSDLLLDLNACHDKSIHKFFDLFICVFNNNVVRVCGWPCRGFNFSLTGPQQEEQIDPIETFVDFEVAHLFIPYSCFGDCHTGASYQKVQLLKLCGWDCQTLFLVSADLSPIIHPPGTASTSEPAIETTSLHQPTPPHTGLSLATGG